MSGSALSSKVRYEIGVPTVSCFGDSFDNKDPKLPVALSFKDDVGIDGIFRHIDDGDIGQSMSASAD